MAAQQVRKKEQMAFEFEESELKPNGDEQTVFFSKVSSPFALKWLKSQLSNGCPIRAELIEQAIGKEDAVTPTKKSNLKTERKSSKKVKDANLARSTSTKKRKAEDSTTAEEKLAKTPKSSGKKAKQKAEPEETDKSKLDVLPQVNQIGARKVMVIPVKNGKKKIYLLKGPMACHQPLQNMVDSSSLLKAKNFAGLWTRFREEGYILLRGALQKSAVDEARAQVVKALQKVKACSEKDETILRNKPGRTIQAHQGDVISGTEFYVSEDQADKERKLWKDVCNGVPMEALLKGSEVTEMLAKFAEIQSEQSATQFIPINFHPFYTWLRIKGKKEMTIEHSDYFHFQRQTVLFTSPSDVADDQIEFLPKHLQENPELRFTDESTCERCKSTERSNQMLLCDECDKGYHLDCLNPPLEEMPKDDWHCSECNPRPVLGTVWIPLESVPVDHGTFCILPKSHLYPLYSKPYKDFQVPNSYWKNAKGQPWEVAAFEPGDMLIFDLKTVHATTKNLHDKYRLSVDTRWCLEPQRANNGETPGSIFLSQIKEGTLFSY